MILVTGGTGFIGRRLVERLVREGEAVRVFGRSAAHGYPTSGPITPEFISGSVTDREAVVKAVEGCHTVYHLAACARPWVRVPREFYAVNVRGTEHVSRAAASEGVTRLVHFSTALVGRAELLITEYQKTKDLGEQVAATLGGRAVIVRPTRVFGPGLMSTANAVTRLIDLYRRGLFRFRLADGGARGNWVFVDDVVEGAVKAADMLPTGTDVTVVHLGGTDATVPQFLAQIARVTGRSRVVLPLPLGLARAAAAVAVMGGYLGITPSISPTWVDLLAEDWPVSSQDAEAALGYQPRGLLEGIRRTVGWLEQGKPITAELNTEWQSV